MVAGEKSPTTHSEAADGGRKNKEIAMMLEDLPWKKLILSIVLDFVGSCSFAVPGFGELFDVAWAPFSAYYVRSLYKKSVPSAYIMNLAEELLPFTDFIPTASISWYVYHCAN